MDLVIMESQADGIIVRQAKLWDLYKNQQVIYRVICEHGVETDNIDIASKKGIPVFFLPWLTMNLFKNIHWH